MESEWFDVAYINFDEAILHGRMDDGRDDEGCHKERTVRVTLTEEQKRAIHDLQIRHGDEMKALLRGFAS